MAIFDVMEPIMMRPSSSHAAGAAKIGSRHSTSVPSPSEEFAFHFAIRLQRPAREV